MAPFCCQLAFVTIDKSEYFLCVCFFFLLFILFSVQFFYIFVLSATIATNLIVQFAPHYQLFFVFSFFIFFFVSFLILSFASCAKYFAILSYLLPTFCWVAITKIQFVHLREEIKCIKGLS